MSGGALQEALGLLAQRDLQERCRGVEQLAELPEAVATDALVTLLGEASWYLRERVVEALGHRPDSTGAVLRVLREGSWFARASACDVLGRTTDLTAAAELLIQIEDRNVSLQKSALRALRSLAEVHGSMALAHRIAALPAERRRRVMARAGHQEPRWAAELERALASVPPSAFGGPEEARPAQPLAGSGATALGQFRRWLRSLPVSPGEVR